MRVVLDSNIIISALNFSGPERRILELARAGRYHLFLSPHILSEVIGVLTRKFDWDRDMALHAAALLHSLATVVEPVAHTSVLEENDADNLVLACALESNADYLVKGDRKHLLPLEEHEGVRIITSAQLLSITASSETPK